MWEIFVVKGLGNNKFKNSRSRMIFKIGVINYFAIFTEKDLCWSLFLIKSQALRPATLLKKRFQQMFSYEYCQIFKDSFFCRTPPLLEVDLNLRYYDATFNF